MMGRAKLETLLLGSNSNRKECFNKRCKGILKKLYELSHICGAGVRLIIKGEDGNIYIFHRRMNSDFRTAATEKDLDDDKDANDAPSSDLSTLATLSFEYSAHTAHEQCIPGCPEHGKFDTIKGSKLHTTALSDDVPKPRRAATTTGTKTSVNGNIFYNARTMPTQESRNTKVGCSSVSRRMRLLCLHDGLQWTLLRGLLQQRIRSPS
ncbi:hypothetical protein KP509_14G038200 [Ceratopteris richardii]|uniref:MADS-box domain-containing protein n=1 Tax=Ceratopteris richardii TaxID=49495 RepID=A0A8T2T927_CERRI|nr:hypothetical protein KP509_14G038200 [Ceratopteris richardii]